MIDDFAKRYLHDELRWIRWSLVETMDGLSEYEIRRPMTGTGTNLLGLVKHLTLAEKVYLGDIFGRPFPGPYLRFDAPGYRNHDSLWVTKDESRADVIGEYHRAWQHADATIQALPVDAPGFVPWWPRPEVLLFNVMVNVLTESNRHAGHADVVREQLCSAASAPAEDDDWAAHRSKIQNAAHRAGEAG